MFGVKNSQMLILLNLSVVTFLVMLGLSIVAPILPTYAESFNVNYVQVGLVISSFAITRMLLDIPAGFILKKYDKRVIMISGLLLIVVSSVIAGLAPDYNYLLLGRTIEGAGSALYVTAATVFLAQISGTEKRGRSMSIYSGVLLLGAIFGPSFGGFVAALYGIRAPFFAYAIVSGLGVIPTLVLPKIANSFSEGAASPHKSGSALHDIWSVLSFPSFLLSTVATFTLFFMRTGVTSMLVPLFAANNLGLDSGLIGLVLTVAGITTAATMVPMGSFSDRIGRRNPLILCLLLSAAVTVLIPLSTGLSGLAVTMAAYGAVLGLSGPIAAYVTDVSPQDKLEVSMGLYRMISDLGFIAGPLLLGYLADTSGTLTFVTGSVPLHIGLVPFAAASLIMVATGLVLFKGADPVKSKNAALQAPTVDFKEKRI
jgi:DHA1 family multidrug resistance protein-like MFS transporter